jgi:hypothetical protein
VEPYPFVLNLDSTFLWKTSASPLGATHRNSHLARMATHTQTLTLDGLRQSVASPAPIFVATSAKEPIVLGSNVVFSSSTLFQPLMRRSLIQSVRCILGSLQAPRSCRKEFAKILL